MGKNLVSVAARLLACVVMTWNSSAAFADMHETAAAEVRAAVEAFNMAYAENEVDGYFDYYDASAMVYFYGDRQDLSAYREEWAAMVAAGGGVEKNELSDIRIQVMPHADVAIASCFVEYRMRAANGVLAEARAFESEVWQKIDGEWKLVNLHYSEIPDEP